MRYILSAILLLFSCTTLPEHIPGCTNSNACNFNPDANEDDGSCAILDCLDECGGIAYLDSCGDCDSDPDNDCNDCSEYLASFTIENVDYDCIEGVSEDGYYCGDLEIIREIIISNPSSIHSGMDVDSNKIITPLEYGYQNWTDNGRLLTLDLNYNENVVEPAFCNFKLNILPENIGNLDSLQNLQLKDNEISNLPENFGNLNNLERLIMESNLLTFLPESFGNLTKLKILRLNDNKLTSIPASIGNLVKLEVLWLQNNQIISLPNEIGILNNLSELFINDNLLEFVPATIMDLENLIWLNLDNNLLSELPESFCNIYSELDIFSISNNFICDSYSIPTCLGGYLGSQICSYCSPNEFLIEEYCADTSDYNILQNFLDLNSMAHYILDAEGDFTFSNNGDTLYTTFPNLASDCVNTDWWDNGRLVEITFQHKKLTSIIPENFGLLDKLEILRLTGNMLSGSIPNSLTNCENLLTLKLSSNNLSGVIPENIGALTRLDSIMLSDNLITGSIPSSIGSMTNIKYLYFDGNLLTGSIPESIGDLEKIVNLYLDNNKLTGEIPSSIGNLLSLGRLYLLNNCLTGPIPAEMCNIYSYNPDFRSMLHNNQFVQPYPDCIKDTHLGNQLTDCPY